MTGGGVAIDMMSFMVSRLLEIYVATLHPQKFSVNVQKDCKIASDKIASFLLAIWQSRNLAILTRVSTPNVPKCIFSVSIMLRFGKYFINRF